MLASAALLIVALAGEPPPSQGASAAPQAAPSLLSMYMDRRIAFAVIRLSDGPDLIFPTRLASVPTMGTTLLLGARFYEVVGRNDLASAYRARSIRRNVLIFSGLAAVVGGTMYGITAPSPVAGAGPDEFTRQMRAQDRTQHIAMGITAGGLVLFGIGAFTNPQPVDEVEMRRLADGYNERLLNTLRLSAASDLPPDGGAERPLVSFGAGPAPGGAMAGVTVAF